MDRRRKWSLLEDADSDDRSRNISRWKKASSSVHTFYDTFRSVAIVLLYLLFIGHTSIFSTLVILKFCFRKISRENVLTFFFYWSGLLRFDVDRALLLKILHDFCILCVFRLQFFLNKICICKVDGLVL